MMRLVIPVLAVALVVGLVLTGLAAWGGRLSPAPETAAGPSAETPPAVLGNVDAQATATAAPAAAPSPTPESTPTPEATAPPTTSPTPEGGTDAAMAKYQAIVQRYLGDLPGTFGVVIKDMKTGNTLRINADRPFPTASLYKLGLMYEVLREAKAGELNLNTKMDITERHMVESEFDEKLVAGMTVTIDRSLWFLITLSSNSAAMALHDYVSWPDVDTAVHEIGMTNTWIHGDPAAPTFGDWRDTLTSSTPEDMLTFFDKLYNGQILDKENNDKMMWLLKNQQIIDRMAKKLPDDVVFPRKTGNLAGVINEVGIMMGPKTDLYVGVMSQDADYESTTTALQNLGLALYQAANE
ncbi:MAG: class A beta-lactamase-related serine hydrolase [Dehalococcoidales bacterium]|nr:class A beta-lactamase-related serine hydrolase [Dehalococcoidales bacterium]